MSENYTVKIHNDDLEAVRKKHRQLYREIEERKNHETHLEHSISKLGIFLENMLGDLWRKEPEDQFEGEPEFKGEVVEMILTSFDFYNETLEIISDVKGLLDKNPNLGLECESGDTDVEKISKKIDVLYQRKHTIVPIGSGKDKKLVPIF